MPIGLTDEQRALAEAISDWAGDASMTEVVRDTGATRSGRLEDVWQQAAKLGVVAVALPEQVGGGGGSLVDLACALEACARALVPGPLLSTAVAATMLTEQPEHPLSRQVLPGISGGSLTIALGPDPGDMRLEDQQLTGRMGVVWDAGSASHLLLSVGEDTWCLVDAGAEGVTVEPGESLDLSRSVGAVRLEDAPTMGEPVTLDRERVRQVALTLAAAEAAGLAGWALDTAVAYAKVREQFGRTIGSFQAVKHLCAQMLELAESVTAVAADAAAAYDEDPAQLAFASAIAGAVALDAAVENTKEAIQVLGGIGFTWEHDAHLYLRRAVANRQLLGGGDRWRMGVAEMALGGQRRAAQLDVDDADMSRAELRAEVEQIAALGESDRRMGLAESGLLAPHWPAPYGRAAGPVEQLVIDEELAAARVERPDLAIAGWAVPTILEHGTDQQKERFVRPTLRGEVVWCQLFSEPGAGSDLASLRTRAERVEEGWRLSGQKVWTSLATEAQWGICLARTDPDAPRHKGITYFLVDMSADGIDIRPLREMTGDAVFNEVFLDGVLVPDDCVVGEVNGGWRLARTTLVNERVAMSGSSLGTSVERLLRVLAERDDVGEALRLRVGGAVADAGTVRALATRAILRSIEGRGPGPESSVQKLVGVRHRQNAAELAFEVLGPEALLGGEVADAAAHELLLTRCLSIAGGTTQVLRNVAAERILGLPRDPG